MKHKKNKWSILLLSAVLITAGNNFIFCQEIKERTERAITGALGDTVKFDVEKYTLPVDTRKKIEYTAGQKFFGDYIYLYRIKHKEKLVAFGFLDNVYGKAMPITFFVLTDMEGKIISTEIIKYREQYGGAVTNKNWNDQFTGKNSTSDFKIGEGVSGISGATISVKSVTKGIKKITLIFEAIKDSL